MTSIPGWQTMGGFSVGVYGGGDFLSSEDSIIPVSHGLNFCYGGPGNQRSTAVQTIDLSGAATDIDAGRVKFYLSGYLGFLAGSYDTIYQINLKAEFQERFRQGAADFDCSGTGERGYQCPGGAAAAHRAGVPAGQRPQGENHDRSVYRQFGTQRLCG